MRILNQRKAKDTDVGGHVIFTDPTGREHDALITAVWGPACINVAYVLKDPTQTDNYGRKTNKQYTSISHGNMVQAHGNFWTWPGEKRVDPRAGSIYENAVTDPTQ